jgi:putative transposase
MKRKRFTKEQIIVVLKEHELGAKISDLCRKHGISEATFYNWKSKYGGMDVSEAKRLKARISQQSYAIQCRCACKGKTSIYLSPSHW